MVAFSHVNIRKESGFNGCRPQAAGVWRNRCVIQTLLHRSQVKVEAGDGEFWDSNRPFWRCLFFLYNTASLRLELRLVFWIAARQLTQSLALTLNRFFGTTQFLFLALSSTRRTNFSMRESSILARCPVQRCCSLSEMDSILGSWASPGMS